MSAPPIVEVTVLQNPYPVVMAATKIRTAGQVGPQTVSLQAVQRSSY